VTRDEVFAEIRRRWGPNVWIQRSKAGVGRKRSYQVGTLEPPGVALVRGQGTSWEAALADAEGK